MTANVVIDNATIVHRERAAATRLAFTDGRIASAVPGALRLDLAGHLVFPGLVNAHDHLHLNCIPPLVHAAPFPNSYAWIDAFEHHHDRPEVKAAASIPRDVRHWHGALKNILCGATTVIHHDPWHEAFDLADFPVRVGGNRHWSHSLLLGQSRSDHPPRYGPDVVASFRATPSTEHWAIHLAEGTDDVAGRELAALDALGCLAGNTMLVHGVGMSESDIDRMIVYGASVTWCPASNLGMLGRTLDPRRLFNAGRLSLGTDSRLTGSHTLLDEMRIAARNSDLTAREIFRLVSRRDGGLIPGLPADCIILADVTDPYDALLAARRSDLRAVVRNGRPVIADHDFAEWFAHCGIETTEVFLDDAPKLMARALCRPEATALERGLRMAS
ncbi:MAG: amidohydrolase [Gemmatimonadetes bacterium]|nr:amidohydrolase [Gemmatimonadota bacterium]